MGQIKKNQYSTSGPLVRSILGGIIGDIAGNAPLDDHGSGRLTRRGSPAVTA